MSNIANNTCTPCPDNCRRCNGSLCLECATPFVLVDGGCAEADHVRLTNGRQPVRCDDGWTTTATGCLGCPQGCRKCNETSCDICEGAFNNGRCVSPPGSELVTNNGVVSCQPGSYLKDDACVPCDVSGEECERCTPDGCLECTDAVVAPNGTCTGVLFEIVDGECISAPNQHFNGSACVACDDHCQRCNGDVCSVCGGGSSVNTNAGRCDETDANALLISPDRVFYDASTASRPTLGVSNVFGARHVSTMSGASLVEQTRARRDVLRGVSGDDEELQDAHPERRRVCALQQRVLPERNRLCRMSGELPDVPGGGVLAVR